MFVAINSKTSQADEYPRFLPKNEGILVLYVIFFIFTNFPRFERPVRAMYQSVEKCFRMHLRAASISPILRVSAGASADTQTFQAGLNPDSDLVD